MSSNEGHTKAYLENVVTGIFFIDLFIMQLIFVLRARLWKRRRLIGTILVATTRTTLTTYTTATTLNYYSYYT